MDVLLLLLCPAMPYPECADIASADSPALSSPVVGLRPTIKINYQDQLSRSMIKSTSAVSVTYTS
jgi:hypothetical protein